MNPIFYYNERKYQTETEEVVDRAKFEGFILPSKDGINKLDNLVKALKGIGYFQTTDLMHNYSYNNLLLGNFSLINIANPSGALATKFGGITYGVNGYLGNGTDSGINSQFNPFIDGVNYTLNNAGRGMVQFSDNAGATINKALDSSSVANNVNTLYSLVQVAQRINQGMTTLPSAVNMVGLGYKSINRDNSSDVRLVNKSTETMTTVASSSIANGNQLILARIDASSVDGLSFYRIGGSVSTVMSQQFRTIYNKYLSSIGLTPIA